MKSIETSAASRMSINPTALQEARRLLRARFNDPEDIWVIFFDGLGDKGRGGNGVTCLPAKQQV